MDFGIDQLDIKRKMKEKLGQNITLRLKFGQDNAVPTGGKGYEIVPTDASQVASTEMINITVNNNEKNNNN